VLLSRLGIEADEVFIRYSPDLVFELDAEGQVALQPIRHA